MEKSSTELFQSKPTKLLTWANCQIFVNTINHGLIAITTFYLTWLCINAGWTTHLSVHTLLSMIGYQVLMSEGILTLYKHNTYTLLVNSREKKTTIHWVLLAVGSAFAITGTIYEFTWRERRSRRHFTNRHAKWGLASMILLLPTLLAGLLALFPQKLKRFLKPLLSKFTHNIFGVAAFATGMVSTILALTDLRWVKGKDPGNMGLPIAWLLSFILVITLIGPAKSLVTQARSFFNR